MIKEMALQDLKPPPLTRSESHVNDFDLPTLPKLKISNDEKEVWFSSCCGKTKTCSRSFIQYMIQCLFSLLVLLFAMWMYAFATEPAMREVWVSTISTIVGLHLPSPGFDKEK